MRVDVEEKDIRTSRRRLEEKKAAARISVALSRGDAWHSSSSRLHQQQAARNTYTDANEIDATGSV
jgi:hypothetical protein